ncbi:arginine N-succinyltransferase [Pseudomonas piscis]
MIVRPASLADLPALMVLARSAGPGLTTLPVDANRLCQRLEWAQKTFAGEAERADADYLFVLESDPGQVVGICALAGAVGMREPWYNYRLGLFTATSRQLGLNRQLPTLFLGNDMTGHSELCSLFLHADYRDGLNGRLLSKARLLFLAEFRQCFGDKVIAEMRGYCDDNGVSPFWEGLGRHFFKMDFADADHLTGLGNKTFIAQLMPKFPLPTCLLPEAARAVIGRVHPNTEPALRMLRAEGFGFKDYIDIFDGGPLIECATGDIRAVRDSQILQLAIGTPGDRASPYLIHNRQFAACRITAAPARLAAGTLIVEATTARGLGLVPGASVRAVSLSAPVRQCQAA